MHDNYWILDYNNYNYTNLNSNNINGISRDFVLPKISQTPMNYQVSSNEMKEIKEEEQNQDKLKEFRSMMNKLMNEIEE